MCRLLLGGLIFAFPAYGLLIPTATDTADAPIGSFIYPGVADQSVANVSDVSVYINDSMIVEYTQFEYTPFLGISLDCFPNETAAFASNPDIYDADIEVAQFGPYENTGLLYFNFTGSNYYINTYCRFALTNESLTSCSWAPWDQVVTPPFNYFPPAFVFSPVFRIIINITSNDQPTLWTRNSTETQKVDASKTISTEQLATCPPSGIPASPVPTAWSVDRYPALDDGVEFPFDPKAMIEFLKTTEYA